MVKKRKIEELAQLFAKYKTYPKEKFTINTAVGWFLENSDSYYAKDLRNDFLPKQNYQSEKRGADLPFWGKEYFSNRKGKRIFIVAQDSQTSDAGSIVFWAHLFGNLDLYKRFKDALGKNPETPLRYDKFILEECKLNLDFLYITDAQKVYQNNSCKKFDRYQSRNLLEEEIDFCQPDVIVFLGGSGLKLLTEEQKLSDYYQSGKDIKIKGIAVFLFPFPTGNGLIWKKKYQKEVEIEIGKLKNNLDGAPASLA